MQYATLFEGRVVSVEALQTRPLGGYFVMTRKRSAPDEADKRDAARAEAERRIAKEKRRKTGRLNLDGLSLGELPASVWELTWLSHLDADHCRLNSLPKSIKVLSRLQYLYLHHNALETLPDDIGELSQLQALHVHRNNLSALPKSLWNLRFLKKLYLSSNALSNVPDGIGNFAALEELSLDRNCLAIVPSTIGKLIRLQALYLHKNNLTDLPEDVGNLGQLRILYLNDNDLRDLPGGLRRLKKLEQLFLHGNSKLSLPPELLGPTWQEWTKERKPPTIPKDILNFFFSRKEDPDGGKPLNEVKLLLIGRGETGKTSLARTMALEKQFDPNQKETPGIAIAPWRLKINADVVTVHVWDFAGQEIAHETHRFFLTERSIYLLVLDGRRGTQEEDADYWLSHVQKYGHESPVVVALNKWQSPAGFVLERRRLKRLYPFIQGFVETDCSSGFGLDVLRDYLRKVIASEQMGAVRARFPARWFQVKERMAQLRDEGCYYLDYRDYKVICGRFGVIEEDKQESLARNLHRLGVALYYGDNPRLRDTRVLVPDWVANGVYAIIRGVQKRGNRKPGQGFLPGAEVAEILQTGLNGMEDAAKLENYPVTPELDTHQFLLDLMVDRELCFVAEGERDTAVYLLPELLAGDEPEEFDVEEFIQSANTRFRYRYDILPDGVLSRFMIRTHPLSEGQPRWKRGVVLGLEDAQALVLTEKRERQLEVFLRGATTESRVRLAGVIRASLRAIHDELPSRMNVREEIDPSAEGSQWVEVAKLTALERNHMKYPVVLDQGQNNEQTIELDPTQELASLQPASARLASAPRLKLFLSYSHRDHKYRDNFAVTLAILKNEGLLDVWWDGELRAGQDWEKIIWDELSNADVVVFLMSNPYFASSYISGIEMRMARERYDRKETLIVPVLLERCSLDAYPWIRRLQIIPAVNGKLVPVVEFLPNQRRGWYAVEEGLRKAIATAAQRASHNP
jgi:internalin A